MPMMRGATSGGGPGDETRFRGETVLFQPPIRKPAATRHAPSLMPEALPAVTVPSGFTTPFQFGQGFEGGVRARMLVHGN